jgi:hypothetical protein
VHRPAKVADLDLAVEADEQILGLDVAVNDGAPMAVAERRAELSDVGGSGGSSKRVAFFSIWYSSPPGAYSRMR